MKKITLYSVGIIAIALCGFFVTKSYPYFQFGNPNLDNGKIQFVSNCAACHGEKGLGDSELAKHLDITPDNIYAELTDPFGFEVELISSVLNGDNGQGGTMPAFKGSLSNKDVHDIFGYVESIN